MLKYNKYLRKIIKPYEYPLKEISEQDTIEDEIRVCTWNLDYALTLTMISYFKAFKEYMIGHPMGYEEINSFEDWEKIIEEIIYGLEYYAKHGKDWTNTKKSAKASKKLRHSLYLISKYYESFWW